MSSNSTFTNLAFVIDLPLHFEFPTPCPCISCVESLCYKSIDYICCEFNLLRELRTGYPLEMSCDELHYNFPFANSNRTLDSEFHELYLRMENPLLIDGYKWFNNNNNLRHSFWIQIENYKRQLPVPHPLWLLSSFLSSLQRRKLSP